MTDPWAPGGKFIESGLEPIAKGCPRCGSSDTEPGDVPRPGYVGDPVSVVCRACSRETSLNPSDGTWLIDD